MAEVSKKIKVDFSAEKPVFSWESPEFIRYKRDKRWFLYVGIIAIVLIVVFWLLKQRSGAILVFVASIVFMSLSGTKPRNIRCAVYSEGLVVGSRVYNYSQFKSFSLIGSVDLPKIYLLPAGRLAGQVILPLGSENPGQIKLFIGKHLPEEESKREDIQDTLNRFFKM